MALEGSHNKYRPLDYNPSLDKAQALVREVMHLPFVEDFDRLLAEARAEERQRRQAFYDLVHENVKAEFINGEIVMHSPVRRVHLDVSALLSASLILHVKENKLGVVYVEKAMVKLTHSDYEPDIAFFSNDKAQYFTEKQLLFPAPDLVVEILSESTAKYDRNEKFVDYASHGVQEYWIIDPELKTLEQYLNEEGAFIIVNTLREGDVLRTDTVAGFEVELSRIFG